MKDFIKLSNGAVFEINDGASLNNIVITAIRSEEAGVIISNKFNSNNISHVEFYSNCESASQIQDSEFEGEPSGVYDDLELNFSEFDLKKMRVVVSLREKGEIEEEENTQVISEEAEEELDSEG